MKLLVLANEWIGLQVASWLREQREDVVGVAIHPPATARHAREIVAASGVGADRVFEAPTLHSPETLARLRQLAPDLILSVYWGYILKPELIALPPRGCINFHCGLVPYNRGKNPNVWPIIEGTPAGVSLHYIDEGIDSGDVIAQREVPGRAIDTGKTLHLRMLQALFELFQQTWPAIKVGSAPRTPQDASRATFHWAKDLRRLDEIDLDAPTTARALLNWMRARTYPPHAGAWFRDADGRKVSVRVELDYAADAVNSAESGNGVKLASGAETASGAGPMDSAGAQHPSQAAA